MHASVLYASFVLTRTCEFETVDVGVSTLPRHSKITVARDAVPYYTVTALVPT